MLIYLGVKKSITPPLRSVILMLVIAALAFFLLPFDWMGEYRFATPFLLLFYLFVLLTGETVYRIAGEKLPAGVLLGILALVFAGTSTYGPIYTGGGKIRGPVQPIRLRAWG